MIFASKDDLLNHLKGSAPLANGGLRLENADKFREKTVDDLVRNAVLNPCKEIRALSRFAIKSAALQMGIFPSSIQGLYEARGQGECHGFTVPALNIRGMSYDLSRAIFRTARKKNAGAFIFEIAKSEMSYTFQPPPELTSVILAAAIRERHMGPVFIQGDHFQVNAKKYAEDPEKEIAGLKKLIDQAIAGGFYNIDIDTSTLVDLGKPNVVEQQRANFEVGVALTHYIRKNEPEGLTISVGGEIGEVGKENSTEEELRAYLDNFNALLDKTEKGAKGISKISVQTGTEHGGVPTPDGKVADVNLDFDTLAKLSRISREVYGLAGAVQHGASTLPADMFHKFPELETAEIHLATDFQNMMYDSKNFPGKFRTEIYDHLRKKFADEKKAGWTDEQFIYKTRKKGFGEFKEQFWNLPESVKAAIGQELETKIDFLFEQLAANNTSDYVKRYAETMLVRPDLEKEMAFA
ncbi:MAG: aldolase [Nitrospinae bacterium CG11_big_fil_rev_8_21_14_0_20_56_8]|nr:MAG: aldolase [Nitrospinae bacterium CG11_big_fil_rev_8_21_14_0_20_56_8]